MHSSTENGAFSAPEVVAGGFWCRNGAFSAPEVVAGGFRCRNGAFSAPFVGRMIIFVHIYVCYV